MESIEVIETEWGSELHKRLIAEKHAARVAYRDSPEAWEEARRMKEAGPLEWGRVIYPEKRKNPRFISGKDRYVREFFPRGGRHSFVGSAVVIHRQAACVASS